MLFPLGFAKRFVDQAHPATTSDVCSVALGGKTALGVLDGAADVRRVDDEGFGDVAGQQRLVTEHVDQAGDAPRVGVDEGQRFRRPLDASIAAGDAQPVVDVFADFLGRERGDVIAQRDALLELAQAVAVEDLRQFGLADEDDLEELLLLGFEVGEQPDLLEHARFEVLGFIDDQRDVVVGGQLAQQERVDRVVQILLGGLGGLQAKLVGDGPQHLGVGQGRIEDQRGFRLGIERIQQGAAEGGFSRADLAGDGDEPFPFADAVQQHVEGDAMVAAQEEELRIRRHIERIFAQSVKFFIHRPISKWRRMIPLFT